MKKLIVLATLAALPAVAMADVTISGNLAVGVVNTKNSGAGSVTTEDRTAGEIKFAGSDDLGNGLKSIWQIATRIDPTGSDTAQGWGNRDTFVGLKGEFGTVTLGNIYRAPATGAMAVFENNSASFKSDLYDQGTRVSNTVSYKAPTVAGFGVVVQHSFGSSNANEQAKKHQQTVELSYEGNGYSASYDTTTIKTGTGTSNRLQELNASVSLSDLTLLAGYAHGKDKGAVSTTKRNGYGLAATYALGNVTPKIGFWKEGDSKTNGATANDGHKAYAVGVDYALSKRTRAGVELAKANFDDRNKADVRTATVYLGTKF